MVVYEKRNQVAYITLNRPQVLNALNLETHEQLCAIWDDFEQDANLRIAVISGSGGKSFSVGQDLKELNSLTEKGRKASSFGSFGQPGWPRLTERFDLSKPVLAKVDGYALGGGFELALSCDVIIASHNSSFGLPEAKLGLIAGAGGIFRLTKQIPYRIAIGYLITGESISATRAYELGLVNEVVSPNELDRCVDDWLTKILRCAPLSVRSIKEVAGKSANLSVEKSFQTEYRWEHERVQGKDCIEGPRAFSEKRKPVWRDDV